MGKIRCSSNAASTSKAPRIERKVIEKNRRNIMKNLYSNLVALLPNFDTRLEGLPLPDQIDETMAYIKSMNMKLEKIRSKKESLLQRKTSDSCITSEQYTSKRTPLVEVQSMGPNIDIILANGLEDYSKFHEIIRLVNQNNDDIVSASFTQYGNSTVQVLHDEVAKLNMGFQSESTLRKLKEMVCGTSSSEQFAESRLDVWDYEIESNIWGFELTDAARF